MVNDYPPALLLKRKETEEMFGKYFQTSDNCFLIINDLMNGIIEVPNKKETLEMLCEYVSACKLTKAALRMIFEEKNMVEEGKFQVDNLQIETLRSSWALLKSLDLEFSMMNLSLSKH